MWAQLLTAAGAAGASPCWGGRQAQAGDLLGHGISMTFRCLDGPPLAGTVGDADVMARLTQSLPLCYLCVLLVFLWGSEEEVPGLLTSDQGWSCIAVGCRELPGTHSHLGLCLIFFLWIRPRALYMPDKCSSSEPHPKPLWHLSFKF